MLGREKVNAVRVSKSVWSRVVEIPVHRHA